MRISGGRLKNLTVRKEKFIVNLAELEKSLSDLEAVQREQRVQIKNLENTIDRKTAQKELVQKEIADAERIARSAKDAVIEFATKKTLPQPLRKKKKPFEASKRWVMSVQSTVSTADFVA